MIDAFDEALSAAKLRKMVILYSEQFTTEKPHAVCAISSDRETIQNYGSRLDKIQKDNRIDIQTTDGYFRLKDEARRLI